MLRIAVCDDEMDICSRLEAVIMEIAERKGRQVEIDVFYSASKLKEYVGHGNRFDAIFLDIEMEGLTGIDFGKVLRNEFKDDSTKIIYISWERDYAMDLFEIRPFHFLIKPLQAQKIEQVMSNLFRLIKSGNHTFSYKMGNETYRIDQRDILFFESENRKINMMTTQGVVTFYGKLSLIMKQLVSGRFWQTHQSYVINYDNVDRFEPGQVIMVSGDEIPISQSKRKEIRDKLTNVIMNGGTDDRKL